MNRVDWGTPEEQEQARKGCNVVDGKIVPIVEDSEDVRKDK